MIKNINLKYAPPQQKQVDQFLFSTGDQLGEGSFGQVFKGVNIKTNENVAIKMIPKRNKYIDPNFIQQEATNMQALKSNNIVKIIKYLETQNNMYIILEYCDGGDLEGLLKKHSSGLDENHACEIIRQLLQGFKEMHSKGYAHRDMKPANVFIHQNIYKIGDLGLAKHLGQKDKMMQSVCGTPLYMSPQILNQESYSEKSDIWSLGLMFYEMLFGKYPWTIRDQKALRKAIKTEPLRFPIDKPINKQTKQFIIKSLQIEEKNRFSWEEIFAHPIFTQQNLNKQQSNEYNQYQKIDSRIKNIIQKLQEIVSKKDDPEEFMKKVFNNFDKNKSGQLNNKEFLTFLQVIDSSLTQLDADKIFNMIDLDDDKTISYDEFTVLFNEYDFSDIEDKSGQLLKELRAIVEAHNLKLDIIFQQYDRNGNGSLSRQEFEALLTIIAEGLQKEDIDRLFVKFDHDGDGDITFQEFFDTIKNKKQSSGKKDFQRQQTQRQQQQGQQDPKQARRYSHQYELQKQKQQMFQHNRQVTKKFDDEEKNLDQNNKKLTYDEQGQKIEQLEQLVQQLQDQLETKNIKMDMLQAQIKLLEKEKEIQSRNNSVYSPNQL